MEIVQSRLNTYFQTLKFDFSPQGKCQHNVHTHWRRYGITITYNVLSVLKLQQLLNGSTQVKDMYKIKPFCLPRAVIRTTTCVKLA